jgi:hypothetical protein
MLVFLSLDELKRIMRAVEDALIAYDALGEEPEGGSQRLHGSLLTIKAAIAIRETGQETRIEIR